MFKQTLLATAATAVLLGPGAAFAAGGMGAGTITFSGSITEAPCTIIPGDTNLNVDLGQVSKKSLDGGVGKFSPTVPINIHLANCTFDPPAAGATGGAVNGLLSKVGIGFGGGITGDEGQVVNTSSPDSGVNIQLVKNDGKTPIKFSTSNTSAEAQQMQNGGTANMMSFFARLVSTAAAVKPGPVSGNATYTLSYF